MKIPLVAGRDIGTEDIRGGVRVMVVSAALAKAAWPNENAIGKRVACCEGTPDDRRYKTVVGVAADVRTQGPTQNIRPEFYVPMVQVPNEAWSWINRTMTAVARAQSGDAASLTPMLRSVVKSVDATIPVYNVSTMSDRIAQSLAESRFHLSLLVALGVVGLLLAAAGIYSVISYFVTLRTHEIGVRMALGATTRDVMRLLTFQGLRPVIAGAVLGAVLASWATRLLRGSVSGVPTDDPATFIAVAAVLLVVAVLAILIRRVARQPSIRRWRYTDRLRDKGWKTACYGFGGFRRQALMAFNGPARFKSNLVIRRRTNPRCFREICQISSKLLFRLTISDPTLAEPDAAIAGAFAIPADDHRRRRRGRRASRRWAEVARSHAVRSSGSRAILRRSGDCSAREEIARAESCSRCSCDARATVRMVQYISVKLPRLTKRFRWRRAHLLGGERASSAMAIPPELVSLCE